MKKLCSALFLVLPRFALFFFTLFFFTRTIFALDLPCRYYPPTSRGRPAASCDDWVSYPEITIRSGSAKKAYNGKNHKRSLLSAHGPVAIAPLGVGVEQKKSKTDLYWHNNKLFLEDPASPTPPAAKIDPKVWGDFLCKKPCTGFVDLSGKYTIDELHIQLRQNIFWGLFIHLFIPVKQQKISCIKYDYCPQKAEDKLTQVSDFLINDLTTVLAENGLKPLSSSFKKTGLGDCAVSVGWQGQTRDELGLISQLKGLLLTGLIFPTGEKKSGEKISALPAGYDDHWGVLMRIQAEAHLFELLELGASAGVITFLKSTKKMRVSSDHKKRQQGIIMLAQTTVNQDSGTLWDLEGYALARAFDWGPFLQLGLSFVRQEAEKLVSRDPCFLQEFKTESIEKIDDFIPLNDIINASESLRSWETFVFHVAIGYELPEKENRRWTPSFSFSYDLPFLGKYTFNTEMFGGQLGCRCSFAF